VPVSLQWRTQEVKGRKTLEATWANGAFRITPRTGGIAGLFYEHSDGPIYDYGCGQTEALKGLAISLAESDLPTPAAFRAAGGDLSACPRPKRLRLGDSEITWRETVEGDAQICVAAVGDGEFRLVQTEGGSFALAFARKGDTDFDQLGCGTREALEVRALDLLGQLSAADADETQPPEKKKKEATTRPRSTSKAMPTTPKTPKEKPPTPDPTPDPTIDASTDKELVDSLTDAVRQAMRGADPDEDEDD
jgi:hypothetical protein